MLLYQEHVNAHLGSLRIVEPHRRLLIFNDFLPSPPNNPIRPTNADPTAPIAESHCQ